MSSGRSCAAGLNHQTGVPTGPLAPGSTAPPASREDTEAQGGHGQGRLGGSLRRAGRSACSILSPWSANAGMPAPSCRARPGGPGGRVARRDPCEGACCPSGDQALPGPPRPARGGLRACRAWRATASPHSSTFTQQHWASELPGARDPGQAARSLRSLHRLLRTDTLTAGAQALSTLAGSPPC